MKAGANVISDKRAPLDFNLQVPDLTITRKERINTKTGL